MKKIIIACSILAMLLSCCIFPSMAATTNKDVVFLKESEAVDYTFGNRWGTFGYSKNITKYLEDGVLEVTVFVDGVEGCKTDLSLGFSSGAGKYYVTLATYDESGNDMDQVLVNGLNVIRVKVSSLNCPSNVSQNVHFMMNLRYHIPTTFRIEQVRVYHDDEMRTEGIALLDQSGALIKTLDAGTMIASVQQMGEYVRTLDLQTAAVEMTLSGDQYVATIPEDIDRFQLHPSVYPTDYEKKLVWSSSDEDVATVSEDGVVTVLKNGTCTISAA